MLMFTTTDLVAIWTKVPTDKGEHEVIIASAYLPGDEETAPTRELVALVNYCKENHLRWIIGCDANAHHTIWGSTNINARGECLLEFLLRYNVSIVNRGNEPTFRNAIREEVLDLTICSPNVLSEVSNWHVSGEASMSDHSLISERSSARRKLDNDKLQSQRIDEAYTAQLSQLLLQPDSLPATKAVSGRTYPVPCTLPLNDQLVTSARH
ncbi:uncharacterized protein LOC128869853 [Anastrepha ludens]|uniref:uncharacterized protein LOC128869853 n=1 Tax=Anastrepha ludens TaxID=28586 RepID=UPI0023AFDD71|nr:uncharacterized protein LOC128869853 [Anastrepha ludens]